MTLCHHRLVPPLTYLDLGSKQQAFSAFQKRAQIFYLHNASANVRTTCIVGSPSRVEINDIVILTIAHARVVTLSQRASVRSSGILAQLIFVGHA